jgi:hypothetical protein
MRHATSQVWSSYNRSCFYANSLIFAWFRVDSFPTVAFDHHAGKTCSTPFAMYPSSLVAMCAPLWIPRLKTPTIAPCFCAPFPNSSAKAYVQFHL